MAALVAIMVMVSIDTFDWTSLRSVLTHPKMSSAVMVVTVLVTVFTSNLALGIAVGVVLSGVFFAFKVARLLHVEMQREDAENPITYRVTGQVSFASADAFVDAFDIALAENMAVEINVAYAHFWDITAVGALEKVVQRYRAHGVNVAVEGLKEASAILIDQLEATERVA